LKFLNIKLVAGEWEEAALPPPAVLTGNLHGG